MRAHPARIFLLFCALLVPAAVLGCGGGGGGGGSEDPQAVLDQTFSNDTKVTSGNLNISLSANAEGDQGGNFTASVSGPFQGDASNDKAFPQLDLTAKVDGSGAGQSINFEGGITATADKAFVSYSGTAYEIPASIFEQFKSAYEAQAGAATSGSSSGNASSILKDLGIDPSTWLTKVTNEGDADVEGDSTIHISGDADVAKIISDFATAAKQIPGSSVQNLDPSVLNQASQFVKNAHVDVYSGADDHVLRKLEFSLDITPPATVATQGVSSVTLDFSISLTDVNQPQDISAPTDAHPFTELEQKIQSLGILGQLGGSALGSTSGGSGSSSSAQQAYAQCVLQAQASGDASAINACLQKLG